MFERYTDQGKRAVFFAQQTALRGGATAIDSGHMLLGLLSEQGTRADTLFRLRDLMPDEASQQASILKEKVVKGTIPLAPDGKRAVAYTAREANQLRDYWIDTEHLVLGILREGSSNAANRLRGVGLDLNSCRSCVVANASSRPAKRDPVLWWVRHRPVGFGSISILLFALGVVAALILLGYVAMGTAFALIIAIQVLRVVIRGDGV